MSRRESPSPAEAKGAAAAAAASASRSDAAHGPPALVTVEVAEGAHTEAAFDALTRALAVEPGHPLAAHLMVGGASLHDTRQFILRSIPLSLSYGL